MGYQCSKCGLPVSPQVLNFEGGEPVHKGCYGKLPTPPAPPPFSRTPLIDSEEFVGRVSIAMTILLLVAFVLL